MLDFGKSPFEAALFLGSFKAISGNHLDCLKILKNYGPNVSFKDFLLLKKSATECIDSSAFEILSYDIVIPESVMHEILIMAINSKNESLVNHILSLNRTYNLEIQTHLIPAIISQNKRIFEMISSNFESFKPTNEILSIAASAGSAEIFVELVKISDNDLILTALGNCISNTSLQHYVPLIIENIILSAEMISHGLIHSVKVRSSDLVKIFVANDGCVATMVHSSFLGALLSNDTELFGPFFSKFNASDLIKSCDISRTATTLIGIKAWKALKIYVENYLTNPNFPKTKFMSLIIKTDQVELAKYVVNQGGRISQSELINVTNKEMREFVMHTISEDLSKSHMKKRK